MNESRRKSKCFLFTLFYPYTHQGVSYDNYIRCEIEKISKRFDEVHVIAIGKDHNSHTPVPANLTFTNLPADVTAFDKLLCGKFLFTKLFWNELNRATKNFPLQISFALVKSLLLFLVKARKYETYLENQFAEIDFTKTDVTLYSYWTFENSLATVLLKQKYPLHVFTRMHSLDLYFDRVPENYLPYRKLIYEKCDATFFISEQGRNYFFETHEIKNENRNKGILNRIGVTNNYAVNNSVSNKIILLSNAWIQPLKRIDLIIESLALIDEFEIEWIHVGDDYGTNRFEEIKNLASKLLSPKKNIAYEFVGRKTQEEIYKIFSERKINLFINVSTTEGIPVSMMEALSFGVPVIATKVGGVPEIIEDGYNGFLLPAQITALEVAGKISLYHNMNENEKIEMMSDARKIWLEKFNAEKNSNELIEELTDR